MNRRTLLAATAAMAIPRAAAFARAADGPAIVDEDPKYIEAIRAFLAKAEIPLGTGTKTRHYLVFDDNPPEHRFDVRRFCEALMTDAIDVFEGAGLAPRAPERRLSVVVLDQGPYDRLAHLVGNNDGRLRQHWYNPDLRTVHGPAHPQGRGPVGADRLGRAPWINFGHEAIHQDHPHLRES